MTFLFRRGSENAAFQNLDLKQYRAKYVNPGIDHTLVDVRTVEEYKQGHMPGAINIPLDQLAAKIGKVPRDKPVVVVCATGNRSRGGSKAFVTAGYEAVFNLKGGTMAWRMQKLPIDY